MTELICDMSNVREKALAMRAVGALQGKQRIEISEYRKRRSDRANRWYWSCFIAPFVQWKRDENEEIITDLEAHDFFKLMFLPKEITDPSTGEVKKVPGPSSTLSNAEFNAYLDRVANWLAEWCGIIVPDPSIYREPVKESQ